jgi:hypothetical protein
MLVHLIIPSARLKGNLSLFKNEHSKKFSGSDMAEIQVQLLVLSTVACFVENLVLHSIEQGLEATSD